MTRYVINHLQIHKDKEQTREFLIVDVDIKRPLCYGLATWHSRSSVRGA